MGDSTTERTRCYLQGMWGFLSQTTVRFWAVVGFVSTVVGFGGVPDDLATWSRWIERAVNDPLVLWLAEYAVAVAEFVNQRWFRAALVIAGVLMMIWPLRWFWRLRHRVSFRWRRILADQVWISESDADKVMRGSTWGRLKEPVIANTFNILSSFVGTREITHGLSDDQKSRLKYNTYLRMTRDKFCSVNSESCREVDGKREIDEVALRGFLDKAVESEIYADFGEVPAFKVD